MISRALNVGAAVCMTFKSVDHDTTVAAYKSADDARMIGDRAKQDSGSEGTANGDDVTSVSHVDANSCGKESIGNGTVEGKKRNPRRGDTGTGTDQLDFNKAQARWRNRHGRGIYEPGDRIKARWHREDVWYPGTIDRVLDNGTFDISYDDGDQELSVQDDVIKLLADEDPKLSRKKHASTPWPTCCTTTTASSQCTRKQRKAQTHH